MDKESSAKEKTRKRKGERELEKFSKAGKVPSQ